MAGLDARIISEAPDTDYKVQLPSEIRNQTIAADVTRRKLEQARDDAHRQAAARQAAQMSDGDPERYLENLQRAGLFDEAVKFQGDMDDSRKKMIDVVKTQNEIHLSQLDQAVEQASQVKTPEAFLAWRARTVKMAPEYDSILPTDPLQGLAAIPQILQGSKSGRDILKAQSDALSLMSDGKYVEGLGGWLAAQPTPEKRAESLQTATAMGYPKAAIGRFSNIDPNDPQYVEKVNAARLTAKEQADLSNTSADNARQDATAAETKRHNLETEAAARRAAAAGVGGAVSPADKKLVDAILKNPTIYAGLTPTVKARIAVPLSEAGFEFKTISDGKPATGVERHTLNFFNRAKQASEELANFEDGIAKSGLTAQAWREYAPNFLQTEQGRAYTAAQRAFTEARLRKDSGAAIPEQEFANDRRTYFVQAGDDAATVEQKRRGRAAILASMGYESGRALAEFYGDEADGMIEGFKQQARQPVAKPGAATSNVPVNVKSALASKGAGEYDLSDGHTYRKDASGAISVVK